MHQANLYLDVQCAHIHLLVVKHSLKEIPHNPCLFVHFKLSVIPLCIACFGFFFFSVLLNYRNTLARTATFKLFFPY